MQRYICCSMEFTVMAFHCIQLSSKPRVKYCLLTAVLAAKRNSCSINSNFHLQENQTCVNTKRVAHQSWVEDFVHLPQNRKVY